MEGSSIQKDQNSKKQEKRVAVTCTYWEGNFRLRNYNAEWVSKLHNMVQRNISVPFDFYCFTNRMFAYDHIKPVALKNDWPGWWSKMEQFTCPALQSYDVVLSLDIDLFVMKSLDCLLGWGWGKPACFAPQTETNLKETDKEGKRRVQSYRTGTFTFTPAALLPYGRQFKKDAQKYIKRYRGDQDWWGDFLPDARTFPPEWFCKTKHLKGKPKPASDVVIVFGNHIKNDKAVIMWDWAKEVWQ